VKFKISIIGSGAFGLSIALELAKNKNFEVTVFEKNNKILEGATFANHNRHHYGYHYPRSLDTIRQINTSKEIFEFYFKKACIFNFPNFYAISKYRTNINAIQYEKFLIQNNLQYQIVPINKNIFNTRFIDKIFKVKEGVYDYFSLKKIYENRIKNSKVLIKLNHKLLDGKINQECFLKFQTSYGIKKIYSDILINATYANYNDIISLFDFETNKSEYNLQEFAILSFKKDLRIGLTVMDGSFPSILPIGRTKFHLFAHVNKSQLIKEISNKNNLFNHNYICTNFEDTFKESKKYINLLKNCIYHKSIISSRVVIKNQDDTRESSIIEHRKNFYSVFSAKIITAEYLALELAKKINCL
jgi:D-amino-acid oxidase